MRVFMCGCFVGVLWVFMGGGWRWCVCMLMGQWFVVAAVFRYRCSFFMCVFLRVSEYIVSSLLLLLCSILHIRHKHTQTYTTHTRLHTYTHTVCRTRIHRLYQTHHTRERRCEQRRDIVCWAEWGWWEYDVRVYHVCSPFVYMMKCRWYFMYVGCGCVCCAVVCPYLSYINI